MKEGNGVWILLPVPLLYLLVYTYFIQYYGPFFTTRIDPEYPYLLNGLNCAQLLFGQIGHVHHPGTPFQMFIGLQLRVIHLIFGEGSIFEDVFARPEFYLQGCSHLLAGLTAIIIWWVGYWGYKVAGWVGMLFIQLSPFYSSVVLLMSVSRFTPDRFVVCILLIIAGLMIRTMVQKDRQGPSFAIICGMLSGVAICSKISCLPVLLIPFILMRKHWWLYGLITIAVFFLFLIPVASRVSDFFAFTGRLATHDGLYGGGNQQMLDWEKVARNLIRIIKFNPAFVVIWFLTLITVIKAQIQGHFSTVIRILFAFILASMASTFLVAKHFKNYYLACILIYSGLALVLLYLYYKDKIQIFYLKTLSLAVIGVVMGLSIQKIVKDHRQNGLRFVEVKSQSKLLDSLDLPAHKILVDPGWQAAPHIEKGITFGISYIRHHHRYKPLINKMFPYVITYEGAEKPMKKLRVVEFDQAELFHPGEHLYFFSKNAKRSRMIFDDLRSRAEIQQLEMVIDTVRDYSKTAIVDISFTPR